MIGTESGPAAFGMIGAMAGHDDGTLAVIDRMSCEIVIVNTSAAQVERRVGGCGGGPGEFQMPVTVTWLADSLFVYDARARRVVVLDRVGEEQRRFDLPIRNEVLQLAGLVAASDTTLLAALALFPQAVEIGREEDRNRYFALIDARDGTTLKRFYDQSEPDMPPTAGRVVLGCVRPGAMPAATMATLSGTSFAGAVVELDSLETVARYSVDLDWARGRVRQGVWEMGGFPSIACAQDVWMTKYIQTEPGGRRGVGGYVEIRDYGGRVLWSKTMTRADSALFGTLRTGIGRRFFLATNTIYEVPVILEFTVEPRGRPTEGGISD